MIKWSEELRVGHPVIDSDHQRLIDIINEFLENEGKTDDAIVLNATLKSLIKYSNEHFAREIQIQKESGYPQVSMHEEEHRVLLVQIKILAKELFINKNRLTDKNALNEVRAILKHWLIDHIKNFDTHMREWVASKDI